MISVKMNSRLDLKIVGQKQLIKAETLSLRLSSTSKFQMKISGYQAYMLYMLYMKHVRTLHRYYYYMERKCSKDLHCKCFE